MNQSDHRSHGKPHHVFVVLFVDGNQEYLMRRCVISLKSEKSVHLSSPASYYATLLSFLLSLFDLRLSWLVHRSELALKKKYVTLKKL